MNPLQSLFGMGGGGGGGMQRTRDFMIEMEVTMAELYLGSNRQISYNRNILCPR